MIRPVQTRRIHAWDLTVAQAARLQARLAPEVIRHIVLGCSAGFRLPETTRCADRLARAAAGSIVDEDTRPLDAFAWALRRIG
jgi:hypothetical protein